MSASVDAAEHVSLDFPLIDSTGTRLALGDILTELPAVIAFSDFSSIRGEIWNRRQKEVLDQAGLRPGRDLVMVTVSLNPEDGPEEAATASGALGATRSWWFLTGECDRAISLARSMAIDGPEASASLVVVMPTGRVAGIVEDDPEELRQILGEKSRPPPGVLSLSIVLMAFAWWLRPLRAR